MAADIKQMISTLLDFYDFKDQTIISVGAGGGQFIEYGRSAKHVVAVDNDALALKKLESALEKLQLSDKFTLIESDFYEFSSKADIVMFEFCLHEMKDAASAIEHALTLAPQVIIGDHLPQSDWAYICDEDKKVTNSWEGINKFEIIKFQQFELFQHYHNYEELYAKVHLQGINSINRISKYKNMIDIKIPMPYGFALI